MCSTKAPEWSRGAQRGVWHDIQRRAGSNVFSGFGSIFELHLSFFHSEHFEKTQLSVRGDLLEPFTKIGGEWVKMRRMGGETLWLGVLCCSLLVWVGCSQGQEGGWGPAIMTAPMLGRGNQNQGAPRAHWNHFPVVSVFRRFAATMSPVVGFLPNPTNEFASRVGLSRAIRLCFGYLPIGTVLMFGLVRGS